MRVHTTKEELIFNVHNDFISFVEKSLDDVMLYSHGAINIKMVFLNNTGLCMFGTINHIIKLTVGEEYDADRYRSDSDSMFIVRHRNITNTDLYGYVNNNVRDIISKYKSDLERVVDFIYSDLKKENLYVKFIMVNKDNIFNPFYEEIHYRPKNDS